MRIVGLGERRSPVGGIGSLTLLRVQHLSDSTSFIFMPLCSCHSILSSSPSLLQLFLHLLHRIRRRFSGFILGLYSLGHILLHS